MIHPSDTQFADWLSWFTAFDDGSTFEQIVRLDSRRFASDGTLAVVTTAPGEAIDPDNDRDKSRADRIRELADAVSDRSVTMSAAELTEAFGKCEHPAVEKCTECDGTGERPHVCSCELCEAEHEGCECDNGKAITCADPRLVRVWGQPVNANLVAYVLEHCPQFESATVSLVGDKKGIFRIETPEWTGIVVVMTVPAMKEMPQVIGERT